MNRYYQSGGQEEQLMQLFQLFADAVQDDEFSTAEEVMQMFQELSPEEQQAFVQQAMQIVQQEQSEAPEQEQMELEEEPVMQRGGYVNNTGYLEGYETSENPYNIIPSNKITMKGVDPKIKYIKGTDNLGNTQYMEHGGEYEFDGDFVLEEPVYAQDGGTPYEKMLRNPEVQELLTMRENKKAGYLGNIKRFQELEGKYGINLTNAQKSFNRSLKKETPVSSKPIPKKVLEAQEKELQRLISEEEIVKQNQIAKQVAEEQELQKLLKQEEDAAIKKQIQEQINAKRRNTILKNKELQRLQKAKETMNVAPVSKKITEVANKFDYGTPGDVKVTFEDLPKKQQLNANTTRTPLYTEEGLPSLRETKINKGISTGAIKPIAKVDLSIGNIGEVALKKLSNGSDEVLNQLKKLKVQNPNIKIADLKKYVPKANVTNALKGLSAIGTAATLYDVYDQFSKLDDPNYVLTDRGVISKEEYEQERKAPKIKIKQDAKDTSILEDIVSGFSEPFGYTYDKSQEVKDTGILEDVVNAFGEPFGYKYDKNFFNKKTPIVKQTIPKGMKLTETIDGKNYYNDKEGRRFTTDKSGKLIMLEDVKSTSLKQDKPKVTLPPKKVNKEIAKQVATPDVLTPPPSVTTGIVDDTFDYRQPLIVDSRFDKYSIPEEERTVELNPNVFNRTNIGVGKRFFKQNGGYYAQQGDFIPQAFEDIELPVNKRLNYNAQPYVGAKTNYSFPITYTNKTKLFPKISEPTLDPIGQYDSMPMGAISANYEAPNQQSRDMFEDRASNQLLDLSSYADRFGVEHFGLNTTPVSDQTVNRKSKLQEFMDKFGKKSDLSFDPRVSNIASAYNLMKASEPLTPQYRPNVRVKYTETPMLDPLPIVQELYNQNRLATQNVNTNSPTGQAFLGNLNAQTQQKTIEVLNDIQQKNNQIAAQNEQARIAAYNQEQQLNIAANQQYLQNQMMAQARKDEMMGSALNDIDRIRNERTKSRNQFSSLEAVTPGLKRSNNINNLLTGTQGFDVDKDYQKLYYSLAQAKTPEEIAAIQKAHQQAMEQKKKTVAQTGGRLNSFFKNKSF